MTATCKSQMIGHHTFHIARNLKKGRRRNSAAYPLRDWQSSAKGDALDHPSCWLAE
jgi:hypothetical protein